LRLNILVARASKMQAGNIGLGYRGLEGAHASQIWGKSVFRANTP
jgi:hypothetical protein